MDCNVFAKGEIPWDSPISQYMRLDYFISLLATKKYYVRPRSEFDDAFESSLPLCKMFPIHAAVEDVPSEVLKEEIQTMWEKLKVNRENGRLLTSCWCLQSHENLLMWNYYASKIGVRVTSTIHRFLSALKTDDFDVLCGCMNYIGYSFNNDDFLFTKDKGYKSEEEFRFYFIPKSDDSDFNLLNSKPVLINVEPLELIERVTVSPYINIRPAMEICKWISDRYGIGISPSVLKISK